MCELNFNIVRVSFKLARFTIYLLINVFYMNVNLEKSRLHNWLWTHTDPAPCDNFQGNFVMVWNLSSSLLAKI